jgi:hypothetical protein
MGRPFLIPRSSLIAAMSLFISAVFLLTFPDKSEAREALGSDYQQVVYLVFPFENG